MLLTGHQLFNNGIYSNAAFYSKTENEYSMATATFFRKHSTLILEKNAEVQSAIFSILGL